ncbi:tetratricopeptide repeat protein [Archangium gephyra]|uniref:Tetratricopeptide repeat protein n=1 Tax=Archangium gephyra TaxID=48 RepID=A0AAC8Q445_9BACT|nr:tetratricopeptide repeat protein [Archangium gephyra]AKJ00081.1 tetratricopeptide repeat protein [Archangium gephyra]REG33220.1 tetratricopeptide repeat protein [Archangium gephyra]
MAKTASRKAPASQKKATREAPKKALKKKSAVSAKKSAAPVKKRVAPVKKPAAAKKRAVPVSPPEPEETAPAGTLPEVEPVPEMKALPAGEPVAGPTLPFEIDPKRVEESLGKLRDELVHWTNKGRYTKVRFKFRGKQLLPDLPIAAVVAAEGLTFYWGGILRALVFTVAGGSLLQVELVNDADKRVQAGKEALLAGDLDEALAHFREALAMDRDNIGAHLNVGVALKLKGDRTGALAAFERAKALDPEGPLGAEAERLAAPLRPKDNTMAQVG